MNSLYFDSHGLYLSLNNYLTYVGHSSPGKPAAQFTVG